MEEKNPATYVVSAMVEQLRAWRRKKTIFPTDQQVNRQDPGSVIHPSRRASGVKGLSKMTTRSRKLGKVRLARLISRGHAEAHAQIRSSRELGDERSCETTRDPCQGEGRSRTGNCRSPESSEHSEGSQRTSLGRVVTRRKRPEVCTCDCRNAHSTGSGSRSS